METQGTEKTQSNKVLVASSAPEGISQLTRSLGTDLYKLLEKQIQLMKLEIEEQLQKILLLGVVGLLSVSGFIMLLHSGAFFLHEQFEFPLSLSFLILSALSLGLGGTLVWRLKKQLTLFPFFPNDSIFFFLEKILWTKEKT